MGEVSARRSGRRAARRCESRGGYQDARSKPQGISTQTRSRRCRMRPIKGGHNRKCRPRTSLSLQAGAVHSVGYLRRLRFISSLKADAEALSASALWSDVSLVLRAVEKTFLMSMDEQTQLGLIPVGDIARGFFVPAYQRGYRWDQEQVSLLLTDIWENQDKDYCLQPVVVKQRADGRFELIDGQQRLTTLYLIFLYMKKEKLQNFDLRFTIDYETRPRSRDYLATLDEAQKDKNIDFFHMYGAYRVIKSWFDGHGARRQHVANKFFGFLYDRVKVIWYEANQDVDSTALFTRLNVGRIPLTNAELVKALLLRRGLHLHSTRAFTSARTPPADRDRRTVGSDRARPARQEFLGLSDQPSRTANTRLALSFSLT